MLGTAFILGLVGSLHCVGMCGPLALAVPVVAGQRALSRAIYHAGRIATYAAVGALAGLAGESLRLAGWQQGLSIALGLLLLAGLAFHWSRPMTAGLHRLKSIFGSLLRRRSFGALFALGLANGLLPCGLVYVAAAAAAATGHLTQAAGCMAAFGAGTLPAMLAVPWLGSHLAPRLPIKNLIPLSILTVAALLILRGLSLDIPFLSPNLDGSCAACH